MPTDPKFRVIAKASKQPLHLVISLYVCMMVDASKNNASRGVTQCHNEDLAVTLDCDMSQIEDIKSAMQGRLLDGDRLTGWENRQPKREDSGNPETGAKSAAERQADKRARDKIAAENGVDTQSHAVSRNVTLEERRGEENISTTTVVDKARSPKFDPKWYLQEHGVSESVAGDWLTLRKAKKAGATKTAIDGIVKEAQKAGISFHEALTICCHRGWASFNSSWDWSGGRSAAGQAPAATETNYQRTMRERVEELTGRKPQPAQGFDNAIDITPTSVLIGSAQ